MKERLPQSRFYQKAPKLVDQLMAMGEIPADSALSPELIHLVQLRASQINNCGFCQHMHADELRKDGVHQSLLDVLPAWRELDCFTKQEQAALEWTEALTRLNPTGIPNDTYLGVLDTLGEDALLDLTQHILAINSWNRISVALQFQPDIKR
jgi:AhpD family alkylhydroperoxidase